MKDIQDAIILEYIYKNNDIKNKKKLISDLNISYSILKYHIPHINNFLSKINIDKIDFKSKNIIQMDKIESTFKNSFEMSKYFFLRSKERKILLLILIIWNSNTTLEMLSSFFKISKNAIFNDLKELKVDLENNKTIKFISSKNGYKIIGSKKDVFKLFINQVIFLVNNDYGETIFNFILQNINFLAVDQKNELLIKDNKKIFKIIEVEVDKLFSHFKYITLQPKTISIILFFKITSISLQSSNDFYKIKNQNFRKTKWFIKIEEFFKNISNIFTKGELFDELEKFIFAQLISSYSDLDQSDDEQKDIGLIFEKFCEEMTKNGFEIKKSKNNLFISYLTWIKILPFKKLTTGHNKEIAFDFFEKTIKRKNYIDNFSIIFEKLKSQYSILSNDGIFYDCAFFFYCNVLRVPYIVKKDEVIYIVTNLKGSLISKYLCDINNFLDFRATFNINSYLYYENNKDAFKDKIIFTEINSLKGPKIYNIYFN